MEQRKGYVQKPSRDGILGILPRCYGTGDISWSSVPIREPGRELKPALELKPDPAELELL